MAATHQPTTPNSKSVRDRIAKFEPKDGSPSKSPASPRLLGNLNGKIPGRGTEPSRRLSVTKDPFISKIPTARSTISSQSGNGHKELEDESLEETVVTAVTASPTEPADVPQFVVLPPQGATTGSSRIPPNIISLDTAVNSVKGVTDSDGTNEVISARSPLDALLSPVTDDTQEVTITNVLINPEATEDEEADGVRFSMVPLSGKVFSEDGKVTSVFSSRTTSIDGMEAPLENVILEMAAFSEKLDSPSLSTFLKNRLDKQEALDDLNLGSNKQLQEEFTKLQNQRVSADTEEEAEKIDWDFWGEVMADYHQFARDNSDDLARAIESGIPASLRGMMWQLMSASKDPELEAEYARLLKETSTHEKAIMRDLGRTFPHHDYFLDGQGIGQENLFNVLKAYSLYDTDVGYCQGLPFVVAVLLLNMPDEEAFCLLVRLMATYGLRGHFLPEMPALQLRLFQFDRLIEEILPVLHVHFLRQGVKSSMYCSQWFLTMFSYRFPLDVVFRIYDNVLATGIEAIFGFSLALLQKNEETLLALKFDDILVHLRNKLFDAYKAEANDEGEHPTYLVNQFVRDASLVRITPFMLDSYAHEYQESVREREAHAIEMDNLRNINRNLSSQIKTLEANLAQLNTEHCEIVKQLVMSRVENEGLESELVRYKLLYADLMHQNEDAGSSHRLSTRPR